MDEFLVLSGRLLVCLVAEDRNFTGFLFLFENLFVCLIDRVEIGTPLV